jgi:hypothetical protein
MEIKLNASSMRNAGKKPPSTSLSNLFTASRGRGASDGRRDQDCLGSLGFHKAPERLRLD